MSKQYKYVCIKEVLIDEADDTEKYRLYFRVGKIYDFEVCSDIGTGVVYVFKHNTVYFLSHKEMEDFFIPLSDWREQQINKILDE